jgi:tRNA G46 methylase TrmB
VSYWDERAKKHGSGVLAVNNDILEEELELFYLERLFDDGDTICDLGCGNGRTTIALAKKFPNSKFIGMDSSEEMIEVAKSSTLVNIEST